MKSGIPTHAYWEDRIHRAEIEKRLRWCGTVERRVLLARNPKASIQKHSGSKVPHILIIIAILIGLACVMTYLVPAGRYEMNSAGQAIPGTFSYVENTPINFWSALLMVKDGISQASSIIALLLVTGGAIAVIISTGAFEELLNYGIYKLQERSVTVLVPSIVVLMSLVGCFAAVDSLISFVTIGVIICKRLRLDRIVAMAMFYLGYLIGQGASFTSTLLMTFQGLADVPLLSGMGMRVIIWLIFTVINAAYCTWYAIRISKDPSKSLTGEILEPDEDMEELTEVRFPVRAVIVIGVMFLCYLVFSYGARNYGWDYAHMMAIMTLDAVFSATVYWLPANDTSKTFLNGAQSMGGIALIMGCARVIGSILTTGNIIHTIAHGASAIIGNFGLATAGLGILIFTLLFNFVIPSGTSKAAIMIPLLTPIGDICGLTRQVVALAYQLGDSLTNTLTPLSGTLMGSLDLAKVDYTKWIRYAAPLMGILAIVAGAFVSILAAISWVG